MKTGLGIVGLGITFAGVSIATALAGISELILLIGIVIGIAVASLYYSKPSYHVRS